MQLNKDILKYIASEFLYHNDAINLICCCKYFNVELYGHNITRLPHLKIKIKNKNIQFVNIDVCDFNIKKHNKIEMIKYCDCLKKIKINQLNLSSHKPNNNLFITLSSIQHVSIIDYGWKRKQIMPKNSWQINLKQQFWGKYDQVDWMCELLDFFKKLILKSNR